MRIYGRYGSKKVPVVFRIPMFLGLPDPSVRGLDPDPSIIKQNSKKNLDSYCFVTYFGFFLSLKDDPDPDPLVRGMDLRIRIRIHTKMSWIRSTAKRIPWRSQPWLSPAAPSSSSSSFPRTSCTKKLR